MTRKKTEFSITVLIIVIILSLVCFVLYIFGGLFVDEEIVYKAMRDAGYTEVQISERNNFFIILRGGDGGDAARFRVLAKNVRGEKVKVYVYVGWPFKNATIRYSMD